MIARAEALLAAEAAPVEVYNFGDRREQHRRLSHPARRGGARIPPGSRAARHLRRQRPAHLDREDRVRSPLVRDLPRAVRHPRSASPRASSRARASSATSPRAAGAPDLEAPITTRERYLESVRRELAFFREAGSRKVARAWYDSLAGLARIAALCRERGVPLAVVVSPSHPQVSRALLEEGARSAGIDPAGLDVAMPQRRLAAFFAERGVPVLDLLPAFAARRARARPRRLLPEQRHALERGGQRDRRAGDRALRRRSARTAVRRSGPARPPRRGPARAAGRCAAPCCGARPGPRTRRRRRGGRRSGARPPPRACGARRGTPRAAPRGRGSPRHSGRAARGRWRGRRSRRCGGR